MNTDADHSHRLLCQLAADEGLARQTDVAELVGLRPSLVSRLWSDPRWLEKIGAEHLIALARALPSLADFLAAQPLALLQQATEELNAEGVSVRDDAVAALLGHGAHPSHVAAALRAAMRLLATETDDDLLATCGLMALFWERQRGRCFERLIPSNPELSLVSDGQAIAGRAGRLLELLLARKPAKGPVLKIDRARQVLIHYLTLHGEPRAKSVGTPRDYAQALDSRCNFTSTVIRDSDYDLVSHYREKVGTDPLARMVEAWMFPAWTGDIPAARPPVTPSHVMLIRTGEEVVREIKQVKYNDAYLYYLAAVYLPLALAIDPALGGHRTGVKHAFRRRFERQSPSPLTEQAVDALDLSHKERR